MIEKSSIVEHILENIRVNIILVIKGANIFDKYCHSPIFENQI